MSEPVNHLTTEQALEIARVATGEPVVVRDLGLLDAAVNRPRASLFGQDAYPDVWHMAAALLHSIVSSHPLVDGNERLGWLATWVFLAKNGVLLEQVDADAAYDLVIAVADGSLRDVPDIARELRRLNPR
ncbi:type II toxin-antitoxin system death-on-curing family toxin [Euzebya tangerina]|uniref:type II toxin-antitoxin system death-on-curing family toxin n=1 Tax=Euzebya tangerina TaxID=591198 RepID=UPI000E3123D1|nr:Fic family protein [Euzebya tangerina]